MNCLTIDLDHSPMRFDSFHSCLAFAPRTTKTKQKMPKRSNHQYQRARGEGEGDAQLSIRRRRAVQGFQDRSSDRPKRSIPESHILASYHRVPRGLTDIVHFYPLIDLPSDLKCTGRDMRCVIGPLCFLKGAFSAYCWVASQYNVGPGKARAPTDKDYILLVLLRRKPLSNRSINLRSRVYMKRRTQH